MQRRLQSTVQVKIKINANDLSGVVKRIDGVSNEYVVHTGIITNSKHILAFSYKMSMITSIA